MVKLKLKANLLDIGTGDTLVVLLDDDTAKQLSVFVGDRVRISTKIRSAICTVDLAEDEPIDTIGIFRETARYLKIKKGQIITVAPVVRPKSLGYIKSKLSGNVLRPNQIRDIVDDIAENKLTKVEIAYFVSAAYVHGFNIKETYELTKAMVSSGIRFRWSRTAVSKHCIGGISGNRTTMLLVPIMAAAGVLMPKTSSRSITSPAGTADTMEVLAPVDVNSDDAMRKIVRATNGCIIWGGALNLAPVDDKIIRVEHPLGLDPTAMLLASILSKKKSEGADRVLIDIPVGKYSKVQTAQRFEDLEQGFVRLGKKLGMRVKVIKTPGNAPIGKGIGPALEARDVLWVLKRNIWGPKDLEEKTLRMAGIMLKLAGKAMTERGGRKLAEEILNSGRAYGQMKKIIKAQGGDAEIDPNRMKFAKKTYTFHAKKAGRVVDIHDDLLAAMAKLAGAPKDKKAGVYLQVAIGDKVRRADAVFTIYSSSAYRLKQAKTLANKIVKIR